MKASEFPSFLKRVKALAFSKLELILRVDIDIDVYGIIVLSWVLVAELEKEVMSRYLIIFLKRYLYF